MIPRGGGSPLVPAPDCLAGDHVAAMAYVEELRRELDRPEWAPAQRARIRARLRLWILRSEGRDDRYERYGTFPRLEGSAPPTPRDLIVAHWRKMFPRSPEERKRRAVPRRFRPKG